MEISKRKIILTILILISVYLVLAQNFVFSGTRILDSDVKEFIAKSVNVGVYHYNKSEAKIVDDIDLIHQDLLNIKKLRK